MLEQIADEFENATGTMDQPTAKRKLADTKKTGGLQEQVTDGENWFGIGIEPSSKAIIGSQDVPYIYEDRLNKEDFIDALTKMLEMSPEERDALGQAGRQHVRRRRAADGRPA